MSDYIAYIVFGGIWIIFLCDIGDWVRGNRKALYLSKEEKCDRRKIADVRFGTDLLTVFVAGTVMTISLFVIWAMDYWEAFFDTETFLSITTFVGMSTLWMLYFWYLAIRHSVEAKIASLFLTDRQKDMVRKENEEAKEKMAKLKAKLGFKRE